MEEKTVKTDGQFEKYPYSFELRINDNIVCQRYFKINGFRETSLTSQQLINTLRYCAKLIQNDLKSKSDMYLRYTAPQIFKDEAQMREWEANPRWKLEVGTYVILEDEEKTFLWDGNKMEPYNQYFNRYDYIPKQGGEVTPCNLKLVFLINDVEVCSTVWDGNVYPRFIRTNIDLSNSKNKYKTSDNFSPFEAAMVDILNNEHRDLIPTIVREFCVACSYDNDSDYDTSYEFGKTNYKCKLSSRLLRETRQFEK